MYRVSTVHPADITAHELQPLFKGCLDEYDAADRTRKVGFSALEYFQWCDGRAQRAGALDVVYFVVSTAESDVPIGFARVVHEPTIPGYQSLPKDATCICLDEIFVNRDMRGRGAYPVLIHHIRTYARKQWDAVYVYARVVSRTFQSELRSYGMGQLPLLVGSLKRLNLPAVECAATDSGNWGVGREHWRSGTGAQVHTRPPPLKEGVSNLHHSKGGSVKGG